MIFVLRYFKYCKWLRDEGSELEGITFGKKNGPLLISNAEVNSVHIDTETLLHMGRSDVEEGVR